ncbi:MAG: DNA methyltransferase [Candidatus Cloacimonadia bacterium]
MSRFNEIDFDNWKESEIITDSLWLFQTRSNHGKHCGNYHGNFIPQIPNQLMLRYTVKDDIVFDPFIGSGTTAFEAENLGRRVIGVELNSELVDNVRKRLDKKENRAIIFDADSTSNSVLDSIDLALRKMDKKYYQLAILHPPYYDIIQFSSNSNDLSNSLTIDDFLLKLEAVIKNAIVNLEPGRYLALIMGDKYYKSEWIPLGFKCMEVVQNVGLKLKSIIVKDIQGNRGKRGQDNIWRYRALKSDYYIFKHEYIFLFKKEVK